MSASFISQTARSALQTASRSRSSANAVVNLCRAQTSSSPTFRARQPRNCSVCICTRSFTASSHLFKKGGKSNTSHAKSDSSPPVDPKIAKTTHTDEAFDVSELEARILKAIERLTHELSTLRSGGRLNPEIIEKLNVELGKAGEKQSVRLSDLAQVVPRGRVINVIVGEKEHVKPVTTAIRASSHSLNPDSPHPDNPMTIPVPIPPPTGESRAAVVEQARTAARSAETAVQDARQGHHKKLRKFQVDRTVRPDDLEKAAKMMEEVVKKGKAEVKRILDGAVRVLDQH